MGSLFAEQFQSAQQWKTTWDSPFSLADTKQKKSESKQNVIPENSAKSAKAQEPSEILKSSAPDATATTVNFLDISDQQAWKTLSVLNAALAKKSAEDEKAAKIEEELSRQNLYKTELCRSFVDTGFCRYGIKCQFAHGSHEIRPVVRHPKYKTEVCKNFATTGHCPYGARCRFIHIGAVQQESDIVWSSSWTSDSPVGIPSKKSAALIEDEEEDTELEGSMKRLAIFQTIAN